MPRRGQSPRRVVFQEVTQQMTFSGKSLSSAVLVVSAAFSTLAMAEGSPVVWTAPSMHRVGMSEAAGSGSEVSLSAARGEYESFQIVANGASNGLGNVNVTVSDLQGPGGQVIPRTNFTLYREKYMHVTSPSPNWKGSNQPMGAGWYPDALIPFTDPDTGKPLSGASLTAVPFDVKAGNNQPIWVDLLVPQTAQPGKYSGTYTVTSNQGNFTGSISLKVWNFALPAAPTLKSSFLFFQAGTLAAQRELLRNKISPLSTNPADQALADEGARLERNSNRTVQRCRRRPLRHVAGAVGKPVQVSGGRAAARPDALRLQRRRNRPLHQPLSHHQAVGEQHAPGRHQEPDLDVADPRLVQRRLRHRPLRRGHLGSAARHVQQFQERRSAKS